MIINCPECGLQVSDKAYTCPHCGLPFKKFPEKKNGNPKKRRRLPNGFGQITKINNQNLRRPYRAMVTVGKYDSGKPIVKLLRPQAYFATYNDAYQALVEYNRDPYDLKNAITVKQLYDMWSEHKFKKCAVATTKNITSFFSHCKPLYNQKICGLTTRQIKDCLTAEYTDRRGNIKYLTKNTKSYIKSILKQMIDYAIEYNFVTRNVADSLSIEDDETNIKAPMHTIYTEEEMKILWDNVRRIDYVDFVLIQCYSGWRPSELLTLRNENINLEKHTMLGGMKTKNGKNRIVPIHPAIESLIKYRMDAKSEYLFTKRGKPVKYSNFYYPFNKMLEAVGININHKLHDGRKHFITLCKESNLNEYAIKYIVGHSITDLTESIYTERSSTWLYEEIKKIKGPE